MEGRRARSPVTRSLTRRRRAGRWTAWAPAWQKCKHRVQVGPGPSEGTWGTPLSTCVCTLASRVRGEQPGPQHVEPARYPQKTAPGPGPPPGHREPGVETGSERGRAGSPPPPGHVPGRAGASDARSPRARAGSTCTPVRVCVSRRHEHVWSRQPSARALVDPTGPRPGGQCGLQAGPAPRPAHKGWVARGPALASSGRGSFSGDEWGKEAESA